MRRLYDSARIYRMDYGVDRDAFTRARRRDRAGQRPRSLLHPSPPLSRLPRARRQPAALPGRGADPRLGMGRLPRARRARAGRRRARQLLDPQRAEHVPGHGQVGRPTTPTPASSRWRRCSTATAKASRSTRTVSSARAAGQNLFLVRDGILFTPPLAASVLPGITRDIVMTLARDLGMQVREQDMPREMLYIADEVFFVGTAAEITPIRSVDKIQVGAGRRGPVTATIQQRVLRLHQRRRARPARLADAGRGAAGSVPRRRGQTRCGRADALKTGTPLSVP